MHVPTHILSGWCAANCFRFDARQRLFCMIAASAPDLDGVGYIFGEATYQTYHHLLCHNVLFIVTVATICTAFAKTNRALTFAFCIALGHLHLVMDYFGSGPLWPIYYLWPFDPKFKFMNPSAWDLFSWQNILAAGLLLAWTIVIGYRQRRTPIELLAPRLDRMLVGHRGTEATETTL